MSTEKINKLQAEIGERPVTATMDNRGLIRQWLTALGAPYSHSTGGVGVQTLAELTTLYNDADAVFAFLVRTGSTLAGQKPNLKRVEPTTPAVVSTSASTIPQTVPQTSNGTNGKSKAERLAEILAEADEAPPLDEARVIDLIKQHSPDPVEPRHIRITIGDREPVLVSGQHYKFPLLLAVIAARVPAYLIGPAGTGKTHAAKAVAETLGLAHGAISVGPMTSKSDLFGMRDAHGIYHESLLVKIAKSGGVFLFDEFDAGNPATLTAINMLLANGEFATPDGMIEKHADFVPVFALNTYGTGASREYVGRNQLDAATLDRGAFIDWPLDEGLEASFFGYDAISPSFSLGQGGIPQGRAWLDAVQSARRCAANASLRHIISPRASLYGYAMADAGIGKTHLEDLLLIKGLDAVGAGKILPNR